MDFRSKTPPREGRSCSEKEKGLGDRLLSLVSTLSALVSLR